MVALGCVRAPVVWIYVVSWCGFCADPRLRDRFETPVIPQIRGFARYVFRFFGDMLRFAYGIGSFA